MLTRLRFDHFLISLSTDLVGRRKYFLFRFEKMWVNHLDFRDRVSSWWNINLDGFSLYRVVKNLALVIFLTME